MDKKHYPFLPFFIIPISGLSTDIYLPSMPAMMQAFESSRQDIQYSITLYVLMMGLMQMVAGPLTDALGRRKPLLLSVVLQISALGLLLIWPTIWMLWIARGLQGAALGFFSVAGRAIITDCYSGSILQKKYNTMTICYAVAPIVAPFIGGVAQTLYGWQLSFVLLLVIALSLGAYIYFFFEESIAQTKAFHISQLYENYMHLFKKIPFNWLVLFICIIMSFNNTIITIGAFLFQKHMGLSPLAYGNIGLAIGAAWFLGNILCRVFFNVSPKLKTAISLAAQSLLVLMLFMFDYFGLYNPYYLAALFAALVFFSAFIFPMYVGIGLSFAPQMAGSINALLFSLLWLAFALVSFLASFLPLSTLYPLAILFLTFNLLSLACIAKVPKQAKA